MRIKDCSACKGRGEVNWSSRYAADLYGNVQTGRLVQNSTSICGVCHGTGMQFKLKPLIKIDLTPEEWYETRDQTNVSRRI